MSSQFQNALSVLVFVTVELSALFIGISLLVAGLEGSLLLKARID
jgi:hypothetical protein